MNKLISVIVLHLLLISPMFAQELTLEGTVVDKTGIGLPGVNVVVDGTQIGTVTNLDGYYSLQIPSRDVTLVYSFIGMNTVKEEVNGRTRIDVILSDDSQKLEDVMVVAYGTTTKEAYTGAAQVVDKEMMENRPVTSFEKSLQGTTAGLQVTSSSGQPGAQATVVIRGIGSLNASSTPLYVIDGVPMAGGLNDINPNDIENLTVLKDAAAASLYGSRAANGVIIITTKKGKAGQTRISFNSQVGISSRISDGYKLMNSSQIYEQSWMGLYNWGLLYGEHENGDPFNRQDAIDYAHGSVKETVGFNPFGVDNPLDDNGQVIPGTKVLTDTDWRDEVYKTGVIQNYNLNVAGGTENTNIFFSLGYYNDSGTTLSSDFTRYTSKINVNHKVNSYISTGISNNLTYSETNAPPGGSGFANPVRSAEVINAASPVYNNDGTYNWDNKAIRDFNPVGLSELDIYRYNDVRGILNAYINVNLLPSLSFRSTGGVDYANSKGLNYLNPYHGDGAGVEGRSSMSRSDNMILSVSNIFNWTKSGADSNFEVLTGQELTTGKSTFLSAEATKFPIPGFPDLSWGAKPEQPSSGPSEWKLLSYLGQAKYNYGGRYYFSASLRGDASTRFGEDNKWGLFYSVGASWRLSEESWMQDIAWLNNLKLRGSYGTSGNSSIGNYASLGLYGSGANYGGFPGIAFVQPENNDIAWESIASFNIGFESRLFNRLDVNMEYYQRDSDGLLFGKPLSASKGFSGIITNLGAMVNKGLEATLDYDAIRTSNFKYAVSFNITSNKNEILNLVNDRILSGSKLLEPGASLHQFYLQEWAGVNPDTGQPMWFVNADSDDKAGNVIPESAYLDPHGSGRQVTSSYSDAERVRKGTALPDFYGGLTNNFSYKNFDFSFYFYYSLGNQIYNDDYATNMHDGSQPGINLAADALDAWTPNNRYTNVPRYVAYSQDEGNQMSTRFLEDASYLRLKNITLGYTLPQAWTERFHLQGLRAFVSGENLFTLTKFKGFDPEAALNGRLGNAIPGVKVVTVGLKIDL
ncbi:TonB-dependent receptor [Carboxylicivirga mesophila]|uniref:TonB-dependent receptor n=2 Tax=Carboxylicivirga TaxID=1628153 RepID=A0A941F3F7_9BACT|nr:MULTISPECIES: TonB-dependent receptor [Carboxylicivirga]MBR8536076.1 TonB-dependent receptor [Carboxylicivirga sediminis]MBS2210756.1 TonB-dependent receptor [Carboxylicivirga mesophila]